MRKLLTAAFAAAALSAAFAGTAMGETDDAAIAQAYYDVLQSNFEYVDGEAEIWCQQVWIADFDRDGTLEMAANFFVDHGGDIIIFADYTSEGTVLTDRTGILSPVLSAEYLAVPSWMNGLVVYDGGVNGSRGEIYSYSSETGKLTEMEESFWDIDKLNLFSSDSSVTNAITTLSNSVSLEAYDYKDIEANVGLLSQASPEAEYKYDSEKKALYVDVDNPYSDIDKSYIRPVLPGVDEEFIYPEEYPSGSTDAWLSGLTSQWYTQEVYPDCWIDIEGEGSDAVLHLYERDDYTKSSMEIYTSPVTKTEMLNECTVKAYFGIISVQWGNNDTADFVTVESTYDGYDNITKYLLIFLSTWAWQEQQG